MRDAMDDEIECVIENKNGNNVKKRITEKTVETVLFASSKRNF